jgi:hypothetical protein
VLVCCLLSLTASLDLSFLDGLFDRYAPTFDRPAVCELDETPEDDDDMLCSPSPVRTAGRQERQSPPGEGPFPSASGSSPQLSCSHSSGPSDVCRSGCEHARRNGLGAPLLC